MDIQGGLSRRENFKWDVAESSIGEKLSKLVGMPEPVGETSEGSMIDTLF